MKLKYFCFLLILIPSFLFCHKIYIFATVDGNKIYTRSYTTDGSKIKEGLIEVYDKNGIKLLTGKTDSLGEFSFVIPKKDDLKIVLIGGMGHRAETIVNADEISEIRRDVVQKEEFKKKEKVGEIIKKEEIQPIDTLILKRMIEDAVDKKINLVIKMLAEDRGRLKFTEIICGIGYIFGILGIISFLMGRKKNV